MLIVNDLITAVLFGQLRLTRQKGVLVLACGYLFAAAMAALHQLTFPGVGIFGMFSQVADAPELVQAPLESAG